MSALIVINIKEPKEGKMSREVADKWQCETLALVFSIAQLRFSFSHIKE